MREILVKTEEFKDSPLGKIPKNWQVDKLVARASVFGGKRLPLGHLYSDTPTEFRYLRVLDFFERDIDFEDLEFLKASTFKALERYEIHNGNLFISIAGSLGYVGVFRPPHQQRTILTENAARILIQDDSVPEFLAYQMNNSVVQKQIEAEKGTGGGVPKLALFRIENLLLVFPPREEQEKIVAILETFDKTIAHTSSLIAKLKQMKAGLLHDLLTRGLDENGELRDAIGHPEQFKDSPLGQIPKDWELRKLTDIASYQNGKSFPSSDYGESGIALLRPGNLPNDNFVLWDKAHTTYLPRKWADIASDYIVLGGELVMNLTAQSLEDQFLGRVCMTPPKTFCLLNQRIARFRAKDCHLPFLFWAIKGTYFRSQIDRIPQGTKVQHIYNSDLEAIILPIPKKQIEQSAIAEILLAQSTRIRTEEAYRDKLKLQKKGLMHDLLTGKVRIKDADKFTSASDTV
jgi:type I restriction enzyme S subunit